MKVNWKYKWIIKNPFHHSFGFRFSVIQKLLPWKFEIVPRGKISVKILTIGIGSSIDPITFFFITARPSDGSVNRNQFFGSLIERKSLLIFPIKFMKKLAKTQTISRIGSKNW